MNVDRKYKLVRRYHVTDASVHDRQAVDESLTRDNTSNGVWADSAYRSAEIEAKLLARSLRSHIHRKSRRNRPLSAREQQGNRTKSNARVRVEHVFGAQVNDMGGVIVKTIGLARAKAKIGQEKPRLQHATPWAAPSPEPMPGMRMMSPDRRNASGAGLTPWLQRRREVIPPAEGWKPANLIRFGFRGAIDRGAPHSNAARVLVSGGDHGLATRKVMAWRLSNTMEAEFCIKALKDAKVENLDGRARSLDRQPDDRAAVAVAEIRVRLPQSIRNRLRGPARDRELADYYNTERPHSRHGLLPPDEAYAMKTTSRKLAA